MKRLLDINSKITIKRDTLGDILCFCTGILALSAVGSLFYTSIHLPYLPELFFIPLVLFYKGTKHRIKLKPTRGFLIILSLELISIVLGVLNTSGDIYGVVTCGRPFVYLTIIGFYYSRDYSKPIPLDLLYLLCLGAQFGEFFGKYFDSAYSSVNSIDHINWLSMSVMIFIPTVRKNQKQLVFSIIVGLINSVFSFYRRIMVFYIASIAIVILYKTIKTKSFKRFAYLIPVSGLVYFVYVKLEQIIERLTSVLHIDYSLFEARFIKKFRAMFNNEVTVSDQVRLNTYNDIKENFMANTIPNGPIGKSMDINSYFGRYTDTPLTYIIDFFGSIGAVIVLVFVAFKAIKCFLIALFKDNLDETYTICALMTPLLLVSLIIDGAFLVHLNYAFVTGYCISGWFFSDRKIRGFTKNG